MKISLLVLVMSLISKTALCEMKEIVFTSTVDGTKQRYVEILPEDFNPSKKHDVIIGLHGHGSDRWQFAKNSRDECAAFRNIADKYKMIAISPDYRAKTSWMGPKAEADLLDIIKEIKKKYQVDRLFIIGGSMGGTSALTFTALHPELVDGVTSLNGHANHLEYENFQDAIIKSFGGTKKEIPEEYKKRSAEYWPERLTMPVAITVGGKDRSVPPDSVLRLAAVLKKLNPSVLVINRPNVGHKTNLSDSEKAMKFMISKAGKSVSR